jgi:CBS domain-containing protein
MMSVPLELREKAEQVKSGRKTSAKVRTLLDWFGAQRRRQAVVGAIRDALAEAGLRTDPDFEHAYIDERVTFLASETEPAPTASTPLVPIDSADTLALETVVQPSVTDPTYRIGKLKSANTPVVSVKPDDPINHTVTLMLHRDFSQLPIMTGPRDVKGMVSWRSLGSRMALGQKSDRALDCMEPHHELDSDTSLFEAIPTIIRRDAVLIRDHAKAICGIVTASDVCEKFRQLTEPFLLLNEVEDHIRGLVTGVFSVAELQAACDPANPRPVKRAADLTLGEYLRLLEKPTHWERLGLQLSRLAFCDYLRQVLRIRNDVMHFDPDGLEPDELSALRDFVDFLRRLRAIRGH